MVLHLLAIGCDLDLGGHVCSKSAAVHCDRDLFVVDVRYHDHRGDVLPGHLQNADRLGCAAKAPAVPTLAQNSE